MTTTTPKPRVVVADDSALMRRIVTNVLTNGGIDVVGAAKDGDEALALCERETPDAMTLDLAMPGLGWIDVLKALKQRGGPAIPVVVVSAFSPAHGAYAVDALAEGAFELVPKPSGQAEVTAFEQNLLTKILVATKTRRLGGHLRTARSRGHGNGAIAPAQAPGGVGSVSSNGQASAPGIRRVHSGLSRVLLIATSTGGPRALAEVIPGLPSPLGLGTIIVQHMPAGFTASLAARLNRSSPLSVREAQGGDSLVPGVALIAPGGRHLRVSPTGQMALTDEAPLGGLRPRADLLIEDAAAKWGDRLTLVVLTGMGNDGLRGAKEVRRHGGRTLVEAEQTCTVYGMPRAVVEAGLADEVLPIDQMAAAIAAEVN
ncbi:MAG: chemotaxis-specific protein-glutamate methyltransferase CheB [Solirubrobacteraceae bacterium]